VRLVCVRFYRTLPCSPLAGLTLRKRRKSPSIFRLGKSRRREKISKGGQK
jgi:hypothetical protein